MRICNFFFLVFITLTPLLADSDIQRARKFSGFQEQYQKIQAPLSRFRSYIFRPLTIAEQPERDTFKKEWIVPGGNCELKLSACGNETRSAQFAIVPTGKLQNIQKIKFVVSDLKSENGSIIPSKNIKLQAVDFVPIDKHREKRSGYNGWKADVLLPAGYIKVYPDAITPIWVKIKIPAETPKGNYHGVIKSNMQAGPVVNIELKVWRFDLPRQTHFPTSFWISRGQLKEYYGRELTWEEYKSWLDAVLEARLSPIDFHEGPCENWFKAVKHANGNITVDISKWKQYVEYVCSRGATSINAGPSHWFGVYIKHFPAIDAVTKQPVVLNTQESRIVFGQALKEAWLFLESKGWADRAYLQPYDEPRTNEAYQQVKEILTVIRQEVPELRTLIALNAPKHKKFFIIADLLDIYVPHDYVYTREELSALNMKGKQGWTYLCVSKAPNLVAKQPWDSRLIWWRYFDSKIEGYLYWGVNFWRQWGGKWKSKRIPEQDRWPAKPWQFFYGDGRFRPGDGVYFLPGPDFKPYPRLCLELTREGMQDVEYFYLLEKLISNEQNKKKYPELCDQGRDLLEQISAVVQNNNFVSILKYKTRIGKDSVMSRWFWIAPSGFEEIDDYRNRVAKLIEELIKR